MEVYFTGTIERIIFENISNFYRILLLEIEDTNAEDFDDFEIIVTGTMADVIEGEEYTFWGQIVQHSKYGEQLQITRYERAKPTSKGLVKYFSSSHFKGIGLKTAQKIVDIYGENTIDKILEHPEKLQSISGLSAKSREAFISTLRLNYGTEMILAKLANYGIPNKLAIQILDEYKEETLDVVENYPYQLVEDIKGLGFTIADQLAEELGIESQSPERFRAGIIHSLLNSCMESGDTYVEARDLLEQTINLLESSRPVELDPNQVALELSHLIEEDKVQQIDTKIFDNSLFFAEEGIHKHLMRILERKEDKDEKKESIQKYISTVEKELGIQYDTIQKQAICDAIQNKVFILTGGPGTGKTTCALILAKALNCDNLDSEGNPCNECENCKMILNDKALEVVEMDAASNRRIDDIRELKEKVIYPPQIVKYKVYIKILGFSANMFLPCYKSEAFT